MNFVTGLVRSGVYELVVAFDAGLDIEKSSGLVVARRYASKIQNAPSTSG